MSISTHKELKMNSYVFEMWYKGRAKIIRISMATALNAKFSPVRFENCNMELTMTVGAMSLVVILWSIILAVEAQPRFRNEYTLNDRLDLAAHNRQYRRGRLPFAVRRNRHSHLPHARFLRVMTGYDHSGRIEEGERGVGAEAAELPPAVDWRAAGAEAAELPAAVDWCAAGAVSAVRDQGYCGSCWAFSAVGALEGQYFVKYGRLVPLSAQSLVDCSSEFGNNGCNSGAMDNAFDYIRDNGGVDTEESYPYEATDGTCRRGRALPGTGALRVARVAAGDEAALLAAVAAGPVAVAVDGSLPSFRAYSAGIYYDPACSKDDLNHAMLLVGYGTDAKGGDYWLLKNTWGTSWGRRGYMKLARNRGNHCGVASAASVPVLVSPGV